MLSVRFIVFALIVAIARVEGLNKIACKLDDEGCLTKSGQTAYSNAITGEQSGVHSDPLRVDVIETNLPTIQYTLHNATVTGLKNCVLERAKFFEDNLKYIYHIACPHITTTAEYEASGKLNEISMEGKGTYEATHENYHIIYLGNYLRVVDENKKLYIRLTDFTLELEANGNVTYEYKNLFNGDVKKSEEFHQYFSKENWKTLDKILGDATMNVFQLEAVKNINKFLKLTPLENIFYIEE